MCARSAAVSSAHDNGSTIVVSHADSHFGSFAYDAADLHADCASDGFSCADAVANGGSDGRTNGNPFACADGRPLRAPYSLADGRTHGIAYCPSDACADVRTDDATITVAHVHTLVRNGLHQLCVWRCRNVRCDRRRYPGVAIQKTRRQSPAAAAGCSIVRCTFSKRRD